MTRDIRPLTLDDLPELSRFLTAGFHAPADADFALPQVLHWKYLEPLGTKGQDDDRGIDSSANGPRSYIARGGESGEIIGHVGLCRTSFEGQGIVGPNGQATTMHIIDWLGSPNHRSVGISLMRKAHEGVETPVRPGSQPGGAGGRRASRL